MGEYTYHKLRPIRLLQLLPSKKQDSEIRCRIYSTLLVDTESEGPNYEALSYAWGDTNKTMSIRLADCGQPCETSSGLSLGALSIGGIPPKKQTPFHEFRITANLHTALRVLRLKKSIRTLWVDAVCINQEDNNEKMQQVSQMRDIYKNAHRVLVWLGEEGDAQIAIDFCNNLNFTEGKNLE